MRAGAGRLGAGVRAGRARSVALQPAEPQWNLLAASDTRAAWTGTWPESGQPLRVEAAALGGRPVAFMLAGPWQKPWRMPDDTSGRNRVSR